MLLSLAAYFVCVALSFPALGNHGLWLSITLFMIARGVTLGLKYPRLERMAVA